MSPRNLCDSLECRTFDKGSNNISTELLVASLLSLKHCVFVLSSFELRTWLRYNIPFPTEVNKMLLIKKIPISWFVYS